MVDRLRIGLEWFLNPDHLPFLIASEKGWFAEADLDVQLVEPREHLDAIDAVEKGEIDLAITEPIHLVADCAKGRSVVGFARFLHTNGGVMYLEKSGIRRPRDMAGARVQYPGAPAPGGLAIVRSMIEADGGEPGELKSVNRGFLHTDALVEGAADVATLAFYNFEIVEARRSGHPANFFALKDWGIPDFCQLILVTSQEKRSDLHGPLSRLVKVMMRGLDFIHQHPNEARNVYYRQTATDEDDDLVAAIFDATVPCFTFDLSMTHEYYRVLAAWMLKEGIVSGPVDAAHCFTNELVL